MSAKKHSPKAAEGSAFRRRTFPDLDLSTDVTGADPAVAHRGDKETVAGGPQPPGGRGRGKVGGNQAAPNVRRYAFRRT
jgi:hypothetical protein